MTTYVLICNLCGRKLTCTGSPVTCSRCQGQCDCRLEDIHPVRPGGVCEDCAKQAMEEC